MNINSKKLNKILKVKLKVIQDKIYREIMIY